MELLPKYTKRQIEILKTKQTNKDNGYKLGQTLNEIEFWLSPTIEKIAMLLLNDKKFIKSLKLLTKDMKRKRKKAKEL